MCPTYSKAKQTETSVWSREEPIARVKKGEQVAVLKRSELPYGFQGRVFKDETWGEGYRVCDFLLIGWW